MSGKGGGKGGDGRDGSSDGAAPRGVPGAGADPAEAMGAAFADMTRTATAMFEKNASMMGEMFARSQSLVTESMAPVRREVDPMNAAPSFQAAGEKLALDPAAAAAIELRAVAEPHGAVARQRGEALRVRCRRRFEGRRRRRPRQALPRRQLGHPPAVRLPAPQLPDHLELAGRHDGLHRGAGARRPRQARLPHQAPGRRVLAQQLPADQPAGARAHARDQRAEPDRRAEEPRARPRPDDGPAQHPDERPRGPSSSAPTWPPRPARWCGRTGSCS